MLGRIKFWLLKWLLNDICEKSDCKDHSSCSMCSEVNVDGYVGFACFEEDVFIQARKVWGLEG